MDYGTLISLLLSLVAMGAGGETDAKARQPCPDSVRHLHALPRRSPRPAIVSSGPEARGPQRPRQPDGDQPAIRRASNETTIDCGR